ncbi:MAG: two-component regulator propeller domain-containing protein [Clostridiales bacterium]
MTLAKYTLYILNLFFFILLFNCKSSAQEYSVTNYSIINEVSGTTVTSSMQDKQGFLWFATKNGAYKFDGRTFQKFPLKVDPRVPNVFDFVQDTKGNFWFLTYRYLFKYDRKSILSWELPKREITVIKDQGKIKERRSAGRLRKIFQENGSIWIYGERSLFQFNGKDFRNFSDQLNLDQDLLHDIIKTKNGYLLFATTSVLKKFNGRGFEICSQYKFLNNVSSMTTSFADRKGNIWTGNKNGDIIKWDINEKKGSIKGNCKNWVLSIYEDSNNFIWVVTREGLYKYDGSHFIFVTVNKEIKDLKINNILEDTEGNIWVGSNCGEVRLQRNYVSKTSSLYNLDFSYVNTIVEDNEKNIWFGSEADGIRIFNGKTFRKYSLGNDKDLNSVRQIFKAKDGALWFVTHRALARLKSGKLKIFGLQDGLKNDKHFWPVMEGKDGNIWFRNQLDICKYDGKNFYYPFYNTPQSHNMLFPGINNEIWMRTESGLYSVTGKTNVKFANGQLKTPSEKNMYGVKWDNQKNFWVFFSEEGFGKITKDGKIKERITEKDGLLGKSLHGIFFDSKGNLWLGTKNGISKFDVEEYNRSGAKHFENFRNSVDEIKSKPMCFYEDSKGNIWIGTTLGIKKFESVEVDRSHLTLPPSVYITSLNLFRENFDYREFSDGIDSQTGLPVNFKLPYTKNYITFNFVGLNFTSPEFVEYKYKLVGFDSTWSPINKMNEVTYTNLPPGKYRFEVLARNKDGLWSTTSASIDFIITPPFWKTWWFFLICFASGSFFVFGFIRIRTSNLEKQKKELEKTIEQRTKELLNEKIKVEEINRDLEKSRYQLSKINELQAKWLDDLSESEKQLTESNTNKDKLFSIISHDLRSPFRALLTYSESVNAKLDTLSTDEIKEYTLNVHHYAENIYKLLEDLLEWSRIQIGNLKYEPGDFSLYAATLHTIATIEGNAERKNIKIINNVSDTIVGYADENMIKSVLNNLVSNAVKFTHYDGLVEINASRINGTVSVTVKDNGTGMSEDEVIQLFKVGKQFHKTGTANEKGTGLGLILCKELIEKNGGSISIASTLGKGSSFSFTIPSQKS